jgi:hypothetical protein
MKITKAKLILASAIVLGLTQAKRRKKRMVSILP